MFYCPEAEAAEEFSPGFNSISAKIIVRHFERRMAFVPEGQADSSQARSECDAERSRPGGTLEVVVSPRSRDRFNRPAGTGLFSL